MTELFQNEVQSPEFAITFNKFSEGEYQELVKSIGELGVDFKHGPLHGKVGSGEEMILIGIVIKLEDREDREKIIGFISGLNSMSCNEVLPEWTEESRRTVEGGGP